MPVSNLKIQLEFRMGAAGWSEVYYKAGSDPKAARPDAQALVNERKKFLVSVAVIHHVRISAAQPGGRAFRYQVVNPAGAVAPSNTRDVTNVTTTVQAWGATAGSRVFKFKGRADDAHAFDMAGNPNNALSPTVQTFMQYLVTAGYQIRTATLAANDPALPKVTGITVDTGTVTFSGTFPGIAVGDKVRVSGVQGFKASQFNGVWTVASLVGGATPGFTADTTRPVDPNFFYVKSSGRTREAGAGDYTFVPIAEFADVENYSTRKAGRPTDSPAGRR